MIDPYTSSANADDRTVQHMATSMLATGLVAEAVGRDGVTAASAAQNETLNNWLTPKEQTLKWRAGKACDAGNETGCQVQRILSVRDAQREDTPSAIFTQGFVNALVQAGGNALLMPVEIAQAIAEGRSLEAMANALKGLVNLPTRLVEGLDSPDPIVRGAAVAESIMVVAGAAAVARSTLAKVGSFAEVGVAATSSSGTTGSRNINFYVTPDGTAVPATGYRAIGGPAVAEAQAGTISPRNPTYITFDNITSMSPLATQDLLQLPRPPSNWVSFDTLPFIGDLSIPTGRWNTTSIPEPITRAFPEWGSGGGTQAVTNQPIQVREFGSLPKGNPQ